MSSDRISARVGDHLMDHVELVTKTLGVYETPSEYIRDLVRRDAESDRYYVYNEIMAGYDDIKNGNLIELTGDWKKDKTIIMQDG